MYKLSVYIPESHLDIVKNALFAQGAGRYKNYDCCAWQTSGQGQFRPLSGSQPTIGQQGQIEYVTEYKVEMICEEAILADVLRALREAHPYEEPAFDVVQLLDRTNLRG